MAASLAARGPSVIQARYLSSRHSRIDRLHWLFAADTREHVLAVANSNFFRASVARCA